MPFSDPFAVYNADSNTEAHLVRGMLHDAGITAVVVEDTSQFVAELQKAQVWIERSDRERAGLVLAEYERWNAERLEAEESEPSSEPEIEVRCEECGFLTRFSASAWGTTQDCPNCRAYVDVGDHPGIDGWEEPERECETTPHVQPRSHTSSEASVEPAITGIPRLQQEILRNGKIVSFALAVLGGLSALYGIENLVLGSSPLAPPKMFFVALVVCGITGVIGGASSINGSRSWSRLGYAFAVPLTLALPVGTAVGVLWMMGRNRYWAAREGWYQELE